MPEPKRVCITGVGAVSPFGRDAASLWAGIQAGRSAVRAVSGFDATGLECRIAAELRDYAPRPDMDADAAGAMDRRSLFAADAAIQALIEAAIPITAETVTQIGIAVGSARPTGERTPGEDVARTTSAAGPVASFAGGRASGLIAIGEAAEWVRREDCAIAVAGGAEAPITLEAMRALDSAGMLTHRNDDPAAAARPYGGGRDGIALAEGAAMVVLEDEEVAVRRGAHILAYVEGYATTFNRAPVIRPAANAIDAGRAMQGAMLHWDLTMQGEIDVIFGAGAGDATDAVEGQAIRRVWGPNTDKIWVTSVHGTLGCALGASGPFGVIAAIYCLQAGLMPPTANVGEQDPECGQLELVTDDVRRFHGTKAMVNAFGSGHNASIILARP